MAHPAGAVRPRSEASTAYLEGIALDTLARNLAVCLRASELSNYEGGKRTFFALLMRMLDCEPNLARRLVEALEHHGHVRFAQRSAGERQGRDRGGSAASWHFHPHPGGQGYERQVAI